MKRDMGQTPHAQESMEAAVQRINRGKEATHVQLLRVYTSTGNSIAQ